MPSTQTNVEPSFRKTTETFTAGAESLSQRYFVSPEIFAKEQKKIFSAQWVLVGHQSQITRPGDYFISQIAAENLIVVRDQRSTIRGFYNVCRHRGTRLREDQTGHASVIQCPYHAWTYALDGRLLGAPHMDDVPRFDKADYSLHPVHLGLWEGFIFVNLADSPTPLDKWFALLAAKFSHWNLPKLRSAKRIDYDVQANWKLIFENLFKCYHCPECIRRSRGIAVRFGRERSDRRTFLGGFMRITKGNSLTMSGKSCALSWRFPGFPSRFYYSIFPTCCSSCTQTAMLHQLRPLSPERTLILCGWFFHPKAFERKDFKPEDAIEFWDMTNKQDWHVCELSQQGIASRAYKPGPYSTRESIPAAWDREYLRYVS
jgi:Rieske 2Fe-2S family protein